MSLRDQKVPPTSEEIRRLDAALRDEQERLLHEAKVWRFSSYGWLDSETVDPEFVGHAMWQTEPPVSFDHLFGNRPAPDYPEWVRLAAVSGADLDGLMNAARMSIGQFLMHAKLTRGQFMAEDNFFDLHWMSAIIYLATASERLRQFLIAAVFRIEQRQYDRDADYAGQRRRFYVTPFTEAADRLKRAAELQDATAKLLRMAEQVRELRLTRNTLVHEIATEIARRERTTIDDPPRAVTDEEFDFAAMKAGAAKIEEMRNKRLDSTISQLAGWYDLLARASNEAFYIEHTLRPMPPASGAVT